MNTEQLQKENDELKLELIARFGEIQTVLEKNDELKAYIEQLREVIFHAACDLAESDIEDDDGLKELHDSLVSVSKRTPAQSLNHILSQVEEETIERCITFANSNWDLVLGDVNDFETMPRKYKEQSNED